MATHISSHDITEYERLKYISNYIITENQIAIIRLQLYYKNKTKDAHTSSEGTKGVVMIHIEAAREPRPVKIPPNPHRM